MNALPPSPPFTLAFPSPCGAAPSRGVARRYSKVSHSEPLMPRLPLPRLRCLALLALCAALGACAPLSPVKPWEKGLLAKPEMGFEGDRLDGLLVEHIYSSKEAASGGQGVGGGGCGCN